LSTLTETIFIVLMKESYFIFFDKIFKTVSQSRKTLYLLVFTYRLLCWRNGVCLTMVSLVLIYFSESYMFLSPWPQLINKPYNLFSTMT